MEPKIELVHLQLTKNCNLRCWFCGQWGNKGFFSDASGTSMEYEDWFNITDQLVTYRDHTGICPDVILWGGEPLIYPHFDKLAAHLAEQGFRLGIVTNGTLIHQHLDVLRTYFHHIYVSVDGDKHIHNRIRGSGVFEKVKCNLELLRGCKGKISIMSVISADNLPILKQLPEVLCALNCDEVLLQEMIYVTAEEAEKYKDWLISSFQSEGKEIDSWISQPMDTKEKKDALEFIKNKNFIKPVRYLPHGVAVTPCKSPNSHIHIAWNGNVLYCTDFYDFSAGNVKEQPLLDIFLNKESQKFREEIQAGNCVTCAHCSWKNSETFRI